ncbi:MAG TPA: hypothetical protein ENN41_02495 [Sediminispirochaeta sp.]|nr:hypothetical protein [Sediminispirochaeta sp.]
MLNTGEFPASAIGPELIALVISILMITGLLLLFPMFRYIRSAQRISDQKIKSQDLLLQETDHRMKNTLMLISSLVKLKLSALNTEKNVDLDLTEITRRSTRSAWYRKSSCRAEGTN